MGVLGVGVDLVDVTRVAAVLGQGARGERFRRRVFTASERRDCEGKSNPAASYSVRFAAKEAVLKALHAEVAWGFPWPDIEVLRGETGAPSVRLYGRTAEKAERLGVDVIHVSLSHLDVLAIAQVVVEKG
ncbi:MAG: holo-ACP synthase [Candidatus Binatia bacterium]